MKKIITLMLITALTVLCMVPAVHAEEAAEAGLFIDTVTAHTGEEATIEFTITKATFASYGLELVYDHEALELISIVQGEADKGAFVNYGDNQTDVAASINFADYTTEGVLFTATFKVLATELDHYPVNVVIDSFIMADAKTEVPVMIVNDGGVSVICDHAWDDGVITVEPGCETDGEKTFTCSKCGETRVETIDAHGHDWEWVIDKEATETEAGEKHEECKICGATRNEGTEIPIPEVGDSSVLLVAVVAIIAAAAVSFTVIKRKTAR